MENALRLLVMAGAGFASLGANEVTWKEHNSKRAKAVQQKDYQEALQQAQAALEDARQSFGVIDPRYADSLAEVGKAYGWLTRWPDAEQVYRQVLAFREHQLGPYDQTVVDSRYWLWYALAMQKKWPDSVEVLEPNLDFYERAYLRDPSSATVRSLTETLLSLGESQRNMGEVEKAEPLFRRALAVQTETAGQAGEQRARAAADLANVLYRQARFTEAVETLRTALSLWEQLRGPDSAQAANSLMDLAEAWRKAGANSEAEPLARRALAVRQKLYGDSHSLTARALNEVGVILTDLGHPEEAERLLLKSLDIGEKADGSQSYSVALYAGNLGYLYLTQRKYAQAEPLLNKAIAIEETALGPEALDLSRQLINLGNVYRQQAHYQKAAPLYRRALAIRESALGPRHADVATAYRLLAAALRGMAEFAEAEKLAWRAVEISRQKTSSSREEANALGQFGSIILERGRVDDAGACLERAMEMLQGGSDSAILAGTVGSLADLRRRQGYYSEAETLALRALDLDRQGNSAEGPATTSRLVELARIYRDQGSFDQAEQILNRAMDMVRSNRGDRLQLASTLFSLADLERDRGQYSQAEEAYRSVAETYEQEFGKDNLRYASVLDDWGLLRLKEGKSKSAEELMGEGLRTVTKTVGSEHPILARFELHMAMVYRELRSYAESERLFKHSLLLQEGALGSNRPARAPALKEYAALLRKTGREEAASAYERRAQQLAALPYVPAKGASSSSVVDIADFGAKPEVVTVGQTARLTWDVSAAMHITLDPSGSEVAAHGSLEVSPSQTTTYTIRASGAGEPQTAAVTVKVRPRPPQIESFTAAPNIVGHGQPATLSWKVTGAEKISIDNGIGAVSASGARQVSPPESMVYTLTAETGNIRKTTVAGITVMQPPRVISTAPAVALPIGWIGKEYHHLIKTGGFPAGTALTWTVGSGALPEGLSVKAEGPTQDGLIYGRPARKGNFQFTLAVSDGAKSAVQAFSIRIDP